MPILPATPGLPFVPGDVAAVMGKIHKAGFDVWVVGGALRDLILGIEPKDWDLATSADTREIISIFPRVIPVGIRHGTVQVHTRTRDIEVTSFEPAGETGILKDLGRRDFTINSLALSYPEGVLIDPNKGREDLTEGLVRAVGNPGARFSEDPLRIVRAARICGIYGFKIDAATFSAMRQRAGELGNVSGERIRDEILKILLSGDPAGAFDLLKNCGALDKLLPRFAAGACRGVSIYEHTISCIVNCQKRIRPRLAALFHETGAQSAQSGAGPHEMDVRRESACIAIEKMKTWNMSSKCIDEVSTLVRHQLSPEALSWSDAGIRKFITVVHPELIEDFIALAEAEALSAGSPETPGKIQGGIEGIRLLRDRFRVQLERVSAFSVRELALSGADIMKILDLAPGPQIGKVLNRLFEMVLEDPELNTREHLTRIVEEGLKSDER